MLADLLEGLLGQRLAAAHPDPRELGPQRVVHEGPRGLERRVEVDGAHDALVEVREYRA